MKTIPTPKKAEFLLNLSQKMAVIVVISKKTMVEPRGAIFEACSEASRRLERKVTTVVVDMDDKAEQAWLKELGVGAPRSRAGHRSCSTPRGRRRRSSAP